MGFFWLYYQLRRVIASNGVTEFGPESKIEDHATRRATVVTRQLRKTITCCVVERQIISCPAGRGERQLLDLP